MLIEVLFELDFAEVGLKRREREIGSDQRMNRVNLGNRMDRLLRLARELDGMVAY